MGSFALSAGLPVAGISSTGVCRSVRVAVGTAVFLLGIVAGAAIAAG